MTAENTMEYQVLPVGNEVGRYVDVDLPVGRDVDRHRGIDLPVGHDVDRYM